jgi:hypothetical protein
MFLNYTHNLPGMAMTKDKGIGSLGHRMIRLMQLVWLMTIFDQA